MKQILLLISRAPKNQDSPLWYPFAQKLQSFFPEEQVVFEVAALNEFTYSLSRGQLSVKHNTGRVNLSDYSVAAFITVSNEPELAIAMQNYLHTLGIACVDNRLHLSGAGKLAACFKLARYNVPQPDTLYAPKEYLVSAARSAGFTYPLIIKADQGKKGRDNYRVAGEEQLSDLLAGLDEQKYILQPEISNEGDYRVLIFGGEPAMIIHRVRVGDTHLNNTSQGGRAAIVPTNTLSDACLRDCALAAQALSLSVAGVDVLIDSRNGQYYILEVNDAPQIASGSFVDQKVQAFGQYLSGLAEDR